MNYKSLTIIALAMCLCIIAVPASAMWKNGNWIPDNANDGYQVHFDPKTGVTSKYKDNNPINEIKMSENGNGGVAVGSVRAGYSTLSQTIYVMNVMQDKNSTPMVITVNPDATFRIPAPDNGVLAPGEYEATLDNFNLPDETIRFTIASNRQEPTRISFIGQAMSGVSTVCQREVLKASYCGMTIPAKTHVEHHDSYYRRASWSNGNYEAGHVHAYKVYHGEYDFKFNGDKYRITNDGWLTAFFQVPAYDETIIDTPAVIGGCADVTQNVREVLAQGYTKFLFDNSDPHHGIYDITTTTLLSSVDDPAIGIVKDVSISYRTCAGVEQTIETKEYQVITLN